MTIVVVGHAIADVHALHAAPLAHGSDTRASISVRGGGAGANLCAWLASAGVACALVCRVGDDPFAAVALGGLDGVDVRAAVDRELPTGTNLVLVGPDGERTMLPDPGAGDAPALQDLPADLFAAGHVLVLSGYVLIWPRSRAAGVAALARARAAGMPVVVDAASAAPLRALGPDVFAAAVGRVDLLVANAEEAPLVAGVDAAERVVKRGGDGAEHVGASGTVTRVAAVPTAVVDTTGAGDAFLAGLLSAWSPGAPDPTAALRAGAALAARAVAQLGARPTDRRPLPRRQ